LYKFALEHNETLTGMNYINLIPKRNVEHDWAFHDVLGTTSFHHVCQHNVYGLR